jgi:hypothetical protein
MAMDKLRETLYTLTSDCPSMDGYLLALLILLAAFLAVYRLRGRLALLAKGAERRKKVKKELDVTCYAFLWISLVGTCLGLLRGIANRDNVYAGIYHERCDFLNAAIAYERYLLKYTGKEDGIDALLCQFAGGADEDLVRFSAMGEFFFAGAHEKVIEHGWGKVSGENYVLLLSLCYMGRDQDAYEYINACYRQKYGRLDCEARDRNRRYIQLIKGRIRR